MFYDFGLFVIVIDEIFGIINKFDIITCKIFLQCDKF